MSAKLLLEYADIFLFVLSVLILCVVLRRGLARTYFALTLYITSVCVLESVDICTLFFRRALGIPPNLAYNVLFFSTWVIAFVQTALVIAIIYGVFATAMKPLKGLHRIGTIVFRWVAVVSAVLALAIAFGPHLFVTGTDSTAAISTIIERFQEGASVLMICLLLFVCFATKPLGLSYRSHIFGISLGLGILSTIQLVQAGWFSTSQAHSVYSPVYLVSTIVSIVAFSTWGFYLAMPEPARKMILIPTTSPFFHWNRIAEALGDAPGNVAIGFNASMISPVETQVLKAMNKGSRDRAEVAAARAASERNTIVAS